MGLFNTGFTTSRCCKQSNEHFDNSYIASYTDKLSKVMGWIS